MNQKAPKLESGEHISLEEAIEKMEYFVAKTEGDGIWHHNAKTIIELARKYDSVAQELIKLLSDEVLGSEENEHDTILRIAKALPWAARVVEKTKMRTLISEIKGMLIIKTIEE